MNSDLVYSRIFSNSCSSLKNMNALSLVFRPSWQLMSTNTNSNVVLAATLPFACFKSFDLLAVSSSWIFTFLDFFPTFVDSGPKGPVIGYLLGWAGGNLDGP